MWKGIANLHVWWPDVLLCSNSEVLIRVCRHQMLSKHKSGDKAGERTILAKGAGGLALGRLDRGDERLVEERQQRQRVQPDVVAQLALPGGVAELHPRGQVRREALD